MPACRSFWTLARLLRSRLQGADQGSTTTLEETLNEAGMAVAESSDEGGGTAASR